MNKTLKPKLDILPPEQRRFWDMLGATPNEFVLYGGTALALRLGHRTSVDFDFFGNDDIDAVESRLEFWRERTKKSRHDTPGDNNQ